MDRMDTSNLPENHPCFSAKRKKVPGTFTDETGGNIIKEFVALRAKSYGYSILGQEIIKAKGVRSHVVKNHMTLDDHKQCLFRNGLPQDDANARILAVQQSNMYTPFRVNHSIRSYHHVLKTIATTKLALNRNDDKRFILEDQVHTLAHGHYKIE